MRHHSVLLLLLITDGTPDSYKVFNRMFEAPILKSRAPNCTPREHEEGSARAEQVRPDLLRLRLPRYDLMKCCDSSWRFLDRSCFGERLISYKTIFRPRVRLSSVFGGTTFS